MDKNEYVNDNFLMEVLKDMRWRQEALPPNQVYGDYDECPPSLFYGMVFALKHNEAIGLKEAHDTVEAFCQRHSLDIKNEGYNQGFFYLRPGDTILSDPDPNQQDAEPNQKDYKTHVKKNGGSFGDRSQVCQPDYCRSGFGCYNETRA